MKYLYALALSFTLLLTACEDKGPAEKAGEKIDEVVEDSKDKVDEIVDDTKDKAEELGNKVEDACEEAKKAVDAKDTDC